MSQPPAARPEFVDFHFDPMCPHAYQTSVWIREIRARTGLAINWRFFSLEEINRAEGKKHPWEREWSYGWSLMRIGALLLFPHLYEIQRPRGRADAEQIAAAFEPHLRARDWVSINRGEVVDFASPAAGSRR